jgi:phosphomannomutase
MKNGFKERCMPVVGVDAYFLKGHHKGQLMVVVGRDANNNMYPIAMAVVEAKTKDS